MTACQSKDAQTTDEKDSGQGLLREALVEKLKQIAVGSLDAAAYLIEASTARRFNLEGEPGLEPNQS